MWLKFLVDYPRPNAGVTHAAGEVVDLPAADAHQFVDGGFAEVAEKPKKDAPPPAAPPASTLTAAVKPKGTGK